MARAPLAASGCSGGASGTKVGGWAMGRGEGGRQRKSQGVAVLRSVSWTGWVRCWAAIHTVRPIDFDGPPAWGTTTKRSTSAVHLRQHAGRQGSIKEGRQAGRLTRHGLDETGRFLGGTRASHAGSLATCFSALVCTALHCTALYLVHEWTGRWQ